MKNLFTSDEIENLETNLNNILSINIDTEIIEDLIFEAEHFYIVESNL